MDKSKLHYYKTRFKQFYVEGWDRLLIKLKEHGGKMLMPIPDIAQHVQSVLDRGRLFDTAKLVHRQSKPNSCHENASRIWAHDEGLQLATGYALAGELWVQHPWLWDPRSNRLIEATGKWDRYFGVILSDEQAVKLATENVPEYLDPAKVTPRIRRCMEKLLQNLNKGDFSMLSDLGLSDPILNQKPSNTTSGKSAVFAKSSNALITKEHPTLSAKKRLAISYRWAEAIQVAMIRAQVVLSDQLCKIQSGGSEAANAAVELAVREIEVSLPLVSYMGKSGEPALTPSITLLAQHDGGVIPDNDSAFENGVSTIISQAIGKPVRVKLFTVCGPQESGSAMMDCVDAQSAWNLTDFVLHENGHDGEEAEQSPIESEAQ